MSQPSDILPLTETLAPADAPGVVEAVREAAGSGTPLYPIGGATMLRYGVPAAKPGLGLSLGAMNRVLDYRVRDLTVTAEPGVTMGELSRQLAAEGQRLPVDVPQPDRATLGGVVAAACAGARRFRWGTMRDYVIGFRAVDGSATPFSGGGQVVKNAAGYNLCRLVTGSLGTLGVITQVSLMVRPLPEADALVATSVPDLDEAERLLEDLVKTPTLPSAVELLTGPAWKEAEELQGAGSGASCRLVVGFEGTSSEVGWMVDQLAEQWAERGVSSPAVLRGNEATRLWRRLADFPAAESGTDGGPPAVAEIRVLPSQAVEMLRLVGEADSECSVQTHAGDGILRVRFSLGAADAAGVLVDKLRPAVAAHGGALVVLSTPDGAAWDRETVWGPASDGAKVMGRLKRQFDPHGILNPGRFIFDDA